jgi:hypothetical protein
MLQYCPADSPRRRRIRKQSAQSTTPIMLIPWSSDFETSSYPPPKEPFAPAIVPPEQPRHPGRYLRASLSRNERLRLSMLWYYTRNIFCETEFLSGLQEKVCIAQESTGWESAIIGILDINFYTRLATVNAPLGILPRGECLCAHTVVQPPAVCYQHGHSGRLLIFFQERLPIAGYAARLEIREFPLRRVWWSSCIRWCTAPTAERDWRHRESRINLCSLTHSPGALNKGAANYPGSSGRLDCCRYRSTHKSKTSARKTEDGRYVGGSTRRDG